MAYLYNGDFKKHNVLLKHKWHSEWNETIKNKLHEIHPQLGLWPGGFRITKRGESVLARIRLGHTHLTCQQEHILTSERTGHNSVSDQLYHLFYSEDCLTRRGPEQCILKLVLVYYSSVIKLLLLLIYLFLS